MARLEAVPGIGRLTAATVAACLARKDFDHPDQFVAFVGLDIAVRQSGKRCGDLGLTREGDAELRRRAAVVEALGDTWDPVRVLEEERAAEALLYAGLDAEQQELYDRLVAEGVLPPRPESTA